MFAVSTLSLLLSLTLQAAPTTQPASPEEQAIRQSAAQYADAFNRGDVDALISQYAQDAIYEEGSGPVLKGREQIRNKLEQTFAESPGMRMSIEVKSIRFLRNRAIEIGVATLTPQEGEPIIAPYRAIHAKQQDGRWLMTSVGPDVTSENAVSAGPLQQLAWLVGSWRDAEENVNVTSNCAWTRNHRFMLRSFVVQDDDHPELRVSEVIGWDPADRVFRSWVFDSDGGFGQSTWSKRNGDWIISATGTLADCGRASAVNIIHPINDDSYLWSSINRDVDGQMLPDLEDIKMIRVPQTQPATEGAQP